MSVKLVRSPSKDTIDIINLSAGELAEVVHCYDPTISTSYGMKNTFLGKIIQYIYQKDIFMIVGESAYFTLDKYFVKERILVRVLNNGEQIVVKNNE